MATDKVTFEMTGHPPAHLWRYKDDFKSDMRRWGYEHTTLTKETDILIAESEDLNSNKCKKARRYGIPIYTYQEAYAKKENLHIRITRKKKIMNLGIGND